MVTRTKSATYHKNLYFRKVSNPKNETKYLHISKKSITFAVDLVSVVRSAT